MTNTQLSFTLPQNNLPKHPKNEYILWHATLDNGMYTVQVQKNGAAFKADLILYSGIIEIHKQEVTLQYPSYGNQISEENIRVWKDRVIQIIETIEKVESNE